MKTIALIGNPNCGKTTLFNALTGAKQHIGNWPGVTVEKKEGFFNVGGGGGEEVKVVDLPGVYSLMATSEDEKATLQYVLSHEANLYVNVVDATVLERNLYLTLLMCELQVPMVVVVTMADIARQRNIAIEFEHLAEHLGVPVIGINANNPLDVRKLTRLIAEELAKPKMSVPTIKLDYGNELEQEIDILSSCTIKTAEAMKTHPKWIALKALEGDPLITKALIEYHDMAPEVIEGSIARVTEMLHDPPDIELAEARYGVIAGLVNDVVKVKISKVHLSEKIDRFVLNRLLGIPIFFGIMYLVFWFTQVVGGAFIDFFEIAGDTIFVSGMTELLGRINAPEWVISIVANGAGTALQTVGTFLPPVGFMFLCLAILEDSGYMARAAFVMDRFMRWMGLPGKSFVPMLIGFGCSVPAIMATRTLESKRDRFLTIFMVPFMSCGAKLPIWVLFATAFFPQNPGRLVFIIYVTGIGLGIITGLILKHTLFQGEPTHFIMELPPYHLPRPKHILLHTWERLRMFLWRAGKFIVPMVLVLGVCDKVGVLEPVGRAITPVFSPIGVERDNWQASVAIFTGLFAKESVIGTMKGLYGEGKEVEGGRLEVDKGGLNSWCDFNAKDAMRAADLFAAARPSACSETTSAAGNSTKRERDMEVGEKGESGKRGKNVMWKCGNMEMRKLGNEKMGKCGNEGVGEWGSEGEEGGYSFIGGMREAVRSVPENLGGIWKRLINPLESEEDADAEGREGAVNALRQHFPQGVHQMFAFLLFVLLYVPCLAATGVVFSEVGNKYGIIFVGYLTLLGWSVAAIYHSIMVSGSSFWLSIGVGILLMIFGSFYIFGRKHRVDMI